MIQWVFFKIDFPSLKMSTKSYLSIYCKPAFILNDFTLRFICTNGNLLYGQVIFVIKIIIWGMVCSEKCSHRIGFVESRQNFSNSKNIILKYLKSYDFEFEDKRKLRLLATPSTENCELSIVGNVTRRTEHCDVY